MSIATHRGARLRRAVAIGLGAALVTTASWASVAHAATVQVPTADPSAPYLGPLNITPTSGTAVSVPSFTAVSTDKACPNSFIGYRTLWVTQDGTVNQVQNATNNLNVNKPMTLPVNRVLFRALANRPWWGELEPGQSVYFVLQCVNRGVGANEGIGTDAYFATKLTKLDAMNWEVSAPEADTPAEKTDTTVTLTSSDVTATSATVTAKVAPADATGKVTFTIGSDKTEIPVANGQAQLGLNDLTANTKYTVKADYSGDTKYNASTAQLDVTTKAAPAANPSAGVDVSVDVPPAKTPESGTGSLQLTVDKTSVLLTGDVTNRLVDKVWTATGALDGVTVTDDRNDASGQGWTLTGKLTDFNGGADGNNTISASALNWTPKTVSGPGEAGGTTTDGLAENRTLATGAASATKTETKLSADMTLAVPGDVKEGNYTSKLTLVLA